MNLLSISNLPSYVEAFASIITAVISIIVLKQQEKIKTLTDVVIEMKDQTNTMQETLELQRHITLPDRIPVFVKATSDFSLNPARVTLENVGTNSFSILVRPRKKSAHDVRIQNDRVSQGKLLNVEIIFPESIDGTPEVSDLHFDIIFSDRFGNQYYQVVKSFLKAVEISPPTLIT